MIDLVVLGSYVAVGITPLVAVKTFEKRKRIARYFKVLFSKNPVYEREPDIDISEYPDAGLSFVEHKIEEDDIQYLIRLKTIHAKAHEEYNYYHKDRQINAAYERCVLLNMLRAEEDERYVQVGAHTMKFGDGLEVWIENRYYAFGKCHRTQPIHEQQGITDSRDVTVSEYTFLRLVDFYEKRAQFTLWKEKHDDYTIGIISKRKHM